MMPENKIIQIVASQSNSLEKEAAYASWYEDVHLPMLFGYEGVKRASRYKLIGDNPDQAKYLAIYEFESAEAMAAFPESPAFAAAVEDYENRKEELGFDMKWAAVYEQTKTYTR